MKQTLRRFCSVMTVFAMLLTVLFVPGTNITTETSSAASSGFSVKGTTLYDANGNPFVMRGTNHAYVWYKGKEETALKAIAATGANTVRIVLGCGGAKQNNPFCSESELSDIIKLCEQNKLIAVLEVHDATGSDSIDDLQTVTNYWLKVKNALVGHEDTVILNIANEWVGTWDSDVWKNGYTKVIPQLRDAGIRNTIMVDAAGWGQYAEAIEQKGKEVFASDKLANTMFSVHMYGYAGGSDSKVKSVIDGVNAQGLCLIVGEFGINHSDGNVAYQSILDYCTQTNTGYLSWSWKGNSGGVEYLDMVNDWEGTSLTEQGKAIIEGQNGIRATSKICSVFTGSSNNNNNNDNNNNNNSNNNNNNNTTTPSNGFSVKGTTLYDANGNPFVMRGINHAYVWYKGKEETALKAIAATGANTVRIVLGCAGAKQNNAYCSEEEISKIIELCEQNKLIAVLEAHDATGSDSIQDLDTVVNYWIKVKNALIGHEDTVILNVANEWAGAWDSANWKTGYLSAIPKLREAGFTHTIMVDCAGWGQYPQSVKDYGKDVFAADPLSNTMFSVHMYEYAGGNSADVKSHIDDITGKGLCMIVGEFGIKHTDGAVAYQTILDYCTQTNTGYLGWSWKGNSGGVEYLDMVNDWEGTSLTEQGKAIIEGQNGIRATSKICSVFGSSNNNNNNNDNNNDQNTDNNNLNGDVNNDGVVTAVDLTLLMQYMVGKAQLSNEKADVNNDGIVNIVDIISLKNSLL